MTTDVKNTVLAERAEAEELLVVGVAMFTRPLPGVTPSMLQRPSLRAVLKTYLDNPGQVENTQSFRDELRKNGEHEGVTEAELARSMRAATDEAAVYGEREHYVRAAADNVKRRHERGIAQAAVDALLTAGAGPDKLADAYRRLAAVESMSQARPRTAGELLDEYLESRKPLEGKDAVGLKTPAMKALSHALCGWHGLVMLGAGPGVGKTSFATAAGLNAVEHDEDACLVFVSVELPTEDMVRRMVATLGGLWSRHSLLQTAEHQAADERGVQRYRRLQDRFAVIGSESVGRLGNTPAAESMEPLRLLVEAERRRLGKKRSFVVLDNMQALDVVDPDGEYFTVDLERDRYVMGGLMELRRRLGRYDPLVVISETNKGAWKAGGGMDALLGSGRLGYGGDCVMTMTRHRWEDEPDDGRPPAAGWALSERDMPPGSVPVELAVWKARDPAMGGGRFRYVMDPATLRFTELVTP
jgi:hypothetical protein